MKKTNPQHFDYEILDTSALPLPKIIRFHDDFSDKLRTIDTLDDEWRTLVDGKAILVKWATGYTPDEQRFLKLFLSWAFTVYDPTSVVSFVKIIQSKKDKISFWVDCLSKSEGAKTEWELNGYNQLSNDLVKVLRPISIFMCKMSLFGWSPDDLEYLRGWNWFAPNNVSNVEHGHGYYLGSKEEHRLVTFFDELSKNDVVDFDVLRNALLLYFCYQFGFRPLQITSVTRKDVTQFNVANGKTVHVTFYKAKQRSLLKKEPLVRKVKREWAPLIAKYIEQDRIKNYSRRERVHEDSFFNLTPTEASNRISDLSLKLTGKRITPTLFRHIAAQRMADLGMSQLELAEFLGHSDTDTCLIYFENSAVQGQVVNRALGLSPVYKKVQNIAEHGFINQNELDSLSGDQQVGGAAHGIPLAGIGGCAIGQSLCELSPAISCYTCPKFLPLHNIETHKNVAEDLGELIVQFEKSGRHDQSNPAYTQLSHTMTKIMSIIESLEPSND